MNDSQWQVRGKFWHVLLLLVLHRIKLSLAIECGLDTIVCNSHRASQAHGELSVVLTMSRRPRLAWGKGGSLRGGEIPKTTKQPHPVFVSKPQLLSTGLLMPQSSPFHMARHFHLLSSTRAYDRYSTYITSFNPHNHYCLHFQKRTLTQGDQWACPVSRSTILVQSRSEYNLPFRLLYPEEGRGQWILQTFFQEDLKGKKGEIIKRQKLNGWQQGRQRAHDKDLRTEDGENLKILRGSTE